MATTAFLTNHERLDAWQRGMELMVESYRLARMLPSEERYGLASQIRRSAVSVPANIAEGCGRGSPGDRLRFFSFARGSLCELRTLLTAGVILGYFTRGDVASALELSESAGQLLSGLQRYVRKSRAT